MAKEPIKGLAEANEGLIEYTDQRYAAVAARHEADGALPQSLESTPSTDVEAPTWERPSDETAEPKAPAKKAAKK